MSNNLATRSRFVYLSSLRSIVTANLLAVLAFPGGAAASVTGQATATVQYDSNSNVFDQSAAAQPGTTSTRQSDTYITDAASFTLDDAIGKQDLFLSGSVDQYHYSHLRQLDNTGYQIDGGLKWQMNTSFDGRLEASETRAMTSFLDTSSTTLSVQTARRESAQLNFKIATDWRLSGSGSTQTTEQTQANGPSLRLLDQLGSLALTYLGFGNFTSGMDVGYATGRYSGGLVNIEPTYEILPSYQPLSYHQTSADLTATYRAGGRSTFSGGIGYSNRSSAAEINSSSGVTGNLSFQDQLTPKTSISISASRAINSYITTASSEFDTSVQTNVNWQATYKLNASAGYVFTFRQFPDQPPIGYPVGTERADIQQSVVLRLGYQPTRWLSLSAFGNFQTRRSNAAEDEFNSNEYGVSFTVKAPQKPTRR
jgi:hypothetical protein